MTSIPEIIIHYQRSIEKSECDRPRLLHCINKLYKLPITVHHLQETGIGRTVNTLRKDDGEVGVAAKALVAKWKAMVAADESDEGEHAAHASANEDEDDPEPPHSNTIVPDVMLTHHSSSQHSTSQSTKAEPSHSSKLRSENDMKSSESNGHHNMATASSSSSFLTSHSTPHKERATSASNHNEASAERSKSSTSHQHHHKSSSSSKQSSAPTTSQRSSSHHSSRKASHPDPLLTALDQDMFKPDVITTTAVVKPSTISSNSHSSTSHKEHHRKNHKSSSSRHKESGDDRPANGSKSSDKVSGSSSSSKHDRHADKRKHESSKHSSSSSKKTGSEAPATLHVVAGKKPKLEAAADDSGDEIEEIDSSMGTSFADALGMVMPSAKSPKKATSSSRSKTSGKSSSSTVAKASTSSSSVSSSKTSPLAAGSSSSAKSDSSRSRPEKQIDFKKPPSLLVSASNLAPLDAEIGLELPTISNNYRPMPLNPIVMDCVFKNAQPAAGQKLFMTDEELGASMSSKTMRTKVYSGVKTGAIHNVTSLHEMCIRVLQRNIDALEYTGGVPYDIIKPILERASPDQLLNMEHFNPYLIEDTDHLWSQHCNRKFRTQKRQEYESWREMFCRCTDEQASRLSHLTKNIKLSQTIAVPLKQTKITFVDSVVKPPRDVIKKQHRFGTERILVATPAARVPTLNSTTSNIAQVGDVRLRVAAGIRDHAQVQSTFRPKKAPLMAKSLQLMNRRFKR